MKKCSCKVVTIKPKLLVVKDKNVSRKCDSICHNKEPRGQYSIIHSDDQQQPHICFCE